jgi:hypothetical protein
MVLFKAGDFLSAWGKKKDSPRALQGLSPTEAEFS